MIELVLSFAAEGSLFVQSLTRIIPLQKKSISVAWIDCTPLSMETQKSAHGAVFEAWKRLAEKEMRTCKEAVARARGRATKGAEQIQGSL
jgi:hypothetical protein